MEIMKMERKGKNLNTLEKCHIYIYIKSVKKESI
jgi:hypothetical protein